MTIDIYEIVKKLIGEINPIGDSNVDRARLENLKVTTGLVDKLVFDIDSIVPNKDRVERSMEQAGEFADKFLTDLREATEE